MKSQANQSYVVGQALSGSADYLGPAIWTIQALGFSVQASWTSVSSLTGVLKLQASNDYQVNGDGSAKNAGTWSDLPAPQSISGSSGSYIWNVTDVFYQYVRIYYAHTSGTGTLNANWVIKGL